MNKEQAEEWADKSLADFKEMVDLEYEETVRKGLWLYDRESWINGYYKGYTKAGKELINEFGHYL